MNDDYGFGQRPDLSLKGPGFAQIPLADGGWMTEYSAGDPSLGGFFYPLIYDGITPAHRAVVRQMEEGGADPFAVRDLQGTAFLAAMQRALRGVSSFWTPDDGPAAPMVGTYGF